MDFFHKIMERLDLKRLRKDAEITQSELANRIGYPQAFLSQIEHGKRPAPDKLIKIVVKELGISNINDYIETVPDPVPSQDLPKLEPLSFDNIIKGEPNVESLQNTISQLVDLLVKSQQRIDNLEKENKKLLELIGKI